MHLPAPAPFGQLLRQWRQQRRLSQLDLALDAEISARHLSYLETGKSQPSREMLLRLAERLQVPLRERNAMLIAAGYAPMFPERPLTDASMAPARRAIERVLAGHEPFPALAVDRHWTLVMANAAVAPLLAGVSPALLEGPVNVLRLSLHPEGLAPRIVNLPHWRSHLLARLHQQIEASADPVLRALLDELQDYPVPPAPQVAGPLPPQDDLGGVAMTLQLATGHGVLSFISTTTVFGTPVDLTLAELALETFFPADAHTAEALPALFNPAA